MTYNQMIYPESLAYGMEVNTINGEMIIRDHVLRQTTVIYRDELMYNPHLAEYAYRRFLSRRE